MVSFKKGTKVHAESACCAGLQVAMWVTHVGGQFRHGLLAKSLQNVVYGETEVRSLKHRVPLVIAWGVRCIGSPHSSVLEERKGSSFDYSC